MKEVESLSGVSYSCSYRYSDSRGLFQKFFQSSLHNNEEFEVQEGFFSVSHKGVIRGMHLQTHNFANRKIVTVQKGVILDVLLDLRPDSETYLCFSKQLMSSHELSTVLVPEGVAHGFQALEESWTLYLSTAVYNPQNDTGIDALSFGFSWPISPGIRSNRDSTLQTLSQWSLNAAQM